MRAPLTVLLGIFFGILLGLPIASTLSPLPAAALEAAFALAAGQVAYRNRANAGFFYLLLLMTVVLLAVFARSMNKAGESALEQQFGSSSSEQAAEKLTSQQSTYPGLP